VLAAALLPAASSLPDTAALAASRPPKLQYEITTLQRLTVVLSEDHSTPIVHVQLVYHVGRRTSGRAHRLCASVRALMFKVRRTCSRGAHLDARVGRRSEQRYPRRRDGVLGDGAGAVPAVSLWLEADRMATLRIDKDTFANERDVVKEERGCGGQPALRPLNEIIYDRRSPCTLQARDDCSMEDLEAASVETCATSTRPSTCGERHAGHRRRLRDGAGADAGEQLRGRVPKSTGRAARHPAGAAQTKEKRVTLQQPWPLPASSSLSRDKDGNPDSYRCTSPPRSVRRPDVAHLQEARLRKADGGGAFRQRNPSRIRTFLRCRIVQPGTRPRRSPMRSSASSNG